MKRGATAILVMLAAATSVSLASAELAHGSANAPEATQRRVRGIITAVDPASVTISPMQSHRQCVTGRIDPTRTRILVDGHPGRPSDLHITYTVRAELSLDDVWMTIRVDSR
jgi:hypothetical protein